MGILSLNFLTTIMTMLKFSVIRILKERKEIKLKWC